MTRCHFPEASEHTCFVFYPIALTPDTALTAITLDQVQQGMDVGDEASCPTWLTPAAQASINGKRAAWAVWEADKLPTGDDLYPHIQRLLGNGAPPSEATAIDTPLAEVYRASEATRKLLQGKRLAYPQAMSPSERQAATLAVHLTPKGKQRIQEHLPAFNADTIPLHLLDMHLVVFRTHHAFVMLELAFGTAAAPIHPSLITEGLYRLAHFHRLSWQPAAATSTTAPCFSLDSVVYSLLNVSSSHTAGRIYTSVYVQLTESPEASALQRLLIQLSRRYTDAYLLSDTNPEIEILNHFKTVHHAFALEGCATVVDLGEYRRADVPEFLQHFARHAYRLNYLPLILLGYHEFVFLLSISERTSIWLPSDDQEGLERLTALRSQISRYMLCYRFSYVSHVSMHNAVNQALRKALGLDKILLEVERDTAQIDSILTMMATRRAEAQRKRHEQRFRWATVIGASALTWLASNKFFTEVFQHPEFQGFAASLGFSQGTWETNTAFIFAIVTALIAAWKTNGGQSSNRKR